MRTKTFLFAAAAIILASCSRTPKTDNPVNYVTDKAKLDMIHSIKDLDNGGGRFYELYYTVDYKLDELVKSDVYDLATLQSFIASNLFDEMPEKLSMGYSAGCSAFAAERQANGHKDFLYARNYDYVHETAAVLLHTAPANGYKSIAMVDTKWGGCSKGFYNDGTTDLSIMMAFPYLIMDGMNEKGFAVSVLHLDGKGTAQNTGKPKVGTTIAMRYLLDHAEDVPQAVDLLRQFDMQASGDGNYHFFLSDAKGNTKTVEYTIAPGDSIPNNLEVLDDRFTTNFYVAPSMADTPDGINCSKHGMDRYQLLKAKLTETDYQLDETEAMGLLEDVSQDINPDEPTSHTQWSEVFNLTERTATVSILREYGKKFQFRIK